MKKHLTDLFFIILGNIILAFAVGVFLLPGNILSGGVAGVAVLLEPIFNIDKTVVVTVLTYGLFIIGSICLGKKFMFQTIISSILYPILLSIIATFDIQINVSNLLLSLYGGLLAGTGIALVIKTGSSTGGMDIPPLIMHKYTGIEISKLVLVCDAITVGCGLFIYGIEDVLIGLISVYATSAAISKVMNFPGQSAKKVEIISDKWEEINNQINSVLDRGTTVFDAQGGYTKDCKKVILVVLSNSQYGKLITLVNEIDSNAFIIVNEATEVHGEGFSIEARV